MSETVVENIILTEWMRVLRPNEFKVLMMILFHCEDRWETRQKVADIQAFTGIRSHETVFKAVSSLVDLRILEVEENVSWGRVYKLNWVAILDGPPEWDDDSNFQVICLEYGLWGNVR